MPRTQYFVLFCGIIKNASQIDRQTIQLPLKDSQFRALFEWDGNNQGKYLYNKNDSHYL